VEKNLMAISLPFIPPTDNLYKFIALSGLLLALGAPVYWTAYQITLDEREESYIHAHLDALGAHVEPYDPMGALNGTLVPTPTPSLDVKAQAEVKQRELYRASVGLGRYARFRVAVNIIAAIAWIVGVLLTLSGFRLWYRRVQVPQDQLLAKQLELKPKPSE
jgi:hypothetical protein